MAGMSLGRRGVGRSPRRRWATVAISAVAALLTTTPARAANTDYVVMLRPGTSLQAHLKALKITPNRVYSAATDGYEAVLNDTQYQRVLASPDVTIITPDAVIGSVTATKPSPPPQPSQVPSFGLRRIGGLASPTAAIDGIDTRINVDVAVVDSGVDASHPDLNVVGGVDCSGKNTANGTVDKRGHGTLVAGVIGAIDNAIGRVGVAPGARIWSVQVANNMGGITRAAEVCAIDWITAHAATIEVANMSLGGAFLPHQEHGNCGIGATKPTGDPIHAAICASVLAGVTYAVAAGNDSTDASDLLPASYDEVITASAIGDSDGAPGGLGPPFPDPVGLSACNFPFTMADDSFASFSNFGADVDLAAPGVCVGSTYPGGLYASASGTSFASPFVAGAAALYISRHPGATPAQVRAALLAAAEPGPIPGDPDTFPEGVVNVSTF
jgi:subtilisin